MAKKTNTQTQTKTETKPVEASKPNKATRKVKFQKLYIGTYGYFMPNQIAEIPANFADSAIYSGVAVYVD